MSNSPLSNIRNGFSNWPFISINIPHPQTHHRTPASAPDITHQEVLQRQPTRKCSRHNPLGSAPNITHQEVLQNKLSLIQPQLVIKQWKASEGQHKQMPKIEGVYRILCIVQYRDEEKMQEESKLLHVINRKLLYQHTTQISQNSPYKQAAKFLRAGATANQKHFNQFSNQINKIINQSIRQPINKRINQINQQISQQQISQQQQAHVVGISKGQSIMNNQMQSDHYGVSVQSQSIQLPSLSCTSILPSHSGRYFHWNPALIYYLYTFFTFSGVMSKKLQVLLASPLSISRSWFLHTCLRSMRLWYLLLNWHTFQKAIAAIVCERTSAFEYWAILQHISTMAACSSGLMCLFLQILRTMCLGWTRGTKERWGRRRLFIYLLTSLHSLRVMRNSLMMLYSSKQFCFSKQMACRLQAARYLTEKMFLFLYRCPFPFPFPFSLPFSFFLSSSIQSLSRQPSVSKEALASPCFSFSRARRMLLSRAKASPQMFSLSLKVWPQSKMNFLPRKMLLSKLLHSMRQFSPAASRGVQIQEKRFMTLSSASQALMSFSQVSGFLSQKVQAGLGQKSTLFSERRQCFLQDSHNSWLSMVLGDLYMYMLWAAFKTPSLQKRTFYKPTRTLNHNHQKLYIALADLSLFSIDIQVWQTGLSIFMGYARISCSSYK